jgi:hypothetical protein
MRGAHPRGDTWPGLRLCACDPRLAWPLGAGPALTHGRGCSRNQPRGGVGWGGAHRIWRGRMPFGISLGRAPSRIKILPGSPGVQCGLPCHVHLTSTSRWCSAAGVALCFFSHLYIYMRF